MRFYLKMIALLLLLAASAASAQLWLGPVGLEVRVVDPKGHPLAGAQLQLRYTGVDPKDGPPPVLTDNRGRANAGGLAEGKWVLEVSHEGYMTYVADLALRRSARPEVLQATQLRVSGATRLLRVEISKGASSAARPSVPAVPAPTPSPAPSTAPPSPAPEEPAPQAPATAPTPAPVPAPTPAPPPTREPAREVSAPTPAPVKPSAPPVPPAQPPAAPTPAAPAPAAPATPSVDAVRVRSSQDRTCAECPPGESAISIERVVPPGGGSGCGAEIARQLAGGEVPSGLPAGCHVLRIALPAGARYTAYRYAVQDGRDSRDCPVGHDCSGASGDSGGVGRWPVNPVLVRKPEGTVILAPFEAGPADRERRVVLTVYFTGKRSR